MVTTRPTIASGGSIRTAAAAIGVAGFAGVVAAVAATVTVRVIVAAAWRLFSMQILLDNTPARQVSGFRFQV